MFYVIEISEGDSKIAGKAMYEYDNEKKAVSTFHKKLGTAMDSYLYTSELVMVIDDNGTVIKREKFSGFAPVEQAETEAVTE